MDFCLNLPFPGGQYQQDHQAISPACPERAAAFPTAIDELFAPHATEADVGMEWLSAFVEDCLSGRGDCLPPPESVKTEALATREPSKAEKVTPLLPLHRTVVSGKARSKRRRNGLGRGQGQLFDASGGSDPLLLDQSQWLADSELIGPRKGVATPRAPCPAHNEERLEQKVDVSGCCNPRPGQQQQQARRCTHCGSQRTPQWRAGPLGPKTLCNACGVRYKSGRLLPEYRPAKSPTFVSHLHSNSHKRVMEMRMSGSATVRH